MERERKLVPLNVMARRLRVTARWLRSEAEEGRLPCLRAERAILFDPTTVEALLLERARGGAAEAPPEKGVERGS